MNDKVDEAKAEDTLADMPITEHLIELRKHIIHIFGAVILIFLVLVGFARDIYDIFSAPLVGLLPHNSTMIATDITSSFLAPVKLTLYVAMFLAMPYILYQIWSFVAPALYKHEKRLAIPVLLSSVVLFYTGIAFAYYVVLKSVLAFFIKFSPDSVLPMTDIESYLNFVLKLFLVFGATFEIPVLTLLLVLAGVVSVEQLADKRRYIIVACFGVSAIVTPPDGLSMVLLAIPMWLLFELGLIFARVLVKEKKLIAIEKESLEG
ncbi:MULTISPECIES: twin-arginine translocase subunit TatC [unclassified Moraxella]|uniref:twin-arginine translocase subunit TatC n=1 Tax=unclassified Moraxella TaxID=2685852 RepID=UPI003AF41EF9